jgi:GNAT superfamily N-acetyltransferase
VVSFSSKDELYPYLDQITEIYNNNCDTEYGFMHITAQDLKEIIDEDLPFADTRFIRYVEGPGSTPAAFILAHRCVADELKRKNKKNSWLSRLQKRKRTGNTDRTDLFTGAVDHRFRGMGIDALLAQELFRECRDNGIKTIDSNLIYETNSLVRRACLKLGGTDVKIYRVFGKKLA